jgi:hypothetical protein
VATSPTFLTASSAKLRHLLAARALRLQMEERLSRKRAGNHKFRSACIPQGSRSV